MMNLTKRLKVLIGKRKKIESISVAGKHTGTERSNQAGRITD